VRRACACGLEFLVLTDHDTVAGILEAREAAASAGLAFGAGIEINTSEGESVHVLGYGIEPASERLNALLEDIRTRRWRRIDGILGLLASQGVELHREDIDTGRQDSVGRPHVADALRSKKLVRTRAEAFQRFLAQGKPAYIPSKGPTMREAIEAVRAAGGWAVLAHPGLLGKDFDLGVWVEMGLEGLEAFYPSHSRVQTSRFVETARRYGLVVTGGSDFHGLKSDRKKLGCMPLPDDVFAAIEGRLRPGGRGCV